MSNIEANRFHLESAVFAEPNTLSGAFSIPGLHIVSNLHVAEIGLLSNFQEFRRFIDLEISRFGLTKVGEVYHNFPGGGYTGVVCLTESHLSIHTWPEHHYLTFDVFLSNYLKDNRDTTTALYARVKDFFQGTVLFEQTINR
jgi:S-adenosylmethionine decarboxylase